MMPRLLLRRRPSAALLVVLLAAPSAAGEIAGHVTDSSGRELAGAVVFALAAPPEFDPVPQTAVMDQVNREFVPEVLVIAAGTEVSFPNRDRIHHHVYSFSRAKTFEIPLYRDGEAPRTVFDQPGVVKLGCNIHDWMLAAIVVVPTSLHTRTDATGAYRLADLPAGRYVLAAWHPHLRGEPEAGAREIEVGAGAVTVDFSLEVAGARARRGGERLRRYE